MLGSKTGSGTNSTVPSGWGRLSQLLRTPTAWYLATMGLAGSTRTYFRSKENAVSTSSRTLTWVVVGPLPVTGSTSPSVTIRLPPRRTTYCVLTAPVVPSATALPPTTTMGTSSPAVGLGGVAAASSGDRAETAPRMLRPVLSRPAGLVTLTSPSRSASTARNSALATHDERSSAMRSRTRNVQIPSFGLVRAGSSSSVCFSSRASAAVRTSNSPYTSARTKVPRISSTRTPTLRKQSGTGDRGGSGSTRGGLVGAALRTSSAVIVSVLGPASVGVAVARRHVAEGGSAESSASLSPKASFGATDSNPSASSRSTSASRRRSLSFWLEAVCPRRSKEAHPRTSNGVPFGIWSSNALEAGSRRGNTLLASMGSVLMLLGFISHRSSSGTGSSRSSRLVYSVLRGWFKRM